MEGIALAELVLSRIDNRLIHGQVLVKWTAQTRADSICIVDDDVAQDAMLIGLFNMAIPKGTTLEVLTAEEVAGFLSAQKGRALLIFKDIQHAETALNTGVPMKKLQVAGLGRREGRVQVYPTVLFYPGRMPNACAKWSKKAWKCIFRRCRNSLSSRWSGLYRNIFLRCSNSFLFGLSLCTKGKRLRKKIAKR